MSKTKQDQAALVRVRNVSKNVLVARLRIDREREILF